MTDRIESSRVQLADESEGRLIEEVTLEQIAGLKVTRTAVDKWRSRHGGSVQEAEEGLRNTVAAIRENGHYELADNGFITMWSRGYRVALSPEAVALVGYATRAVAPSLSEAGKPFLEGVTPAVKSRGGVKKTKEEVFEMSSDDVEAIRIPTAAIKTMAAAVKRGYSTLRDDIWDAIDGAIEGESFEQTDRGWVFTYGGWTMHTDAGVRKLLEISGYTAVSSEDTVEASA